MKRDLYYLDTETVGLVGPAVLIQYARGDSDVTLFHVWDHTHRQVMDLIEEFMDVGYVAFNATFDHYHLQKLYCLCWALGPDRWDDPMPSAEVLSKYERRSVFGPCLRPRVLVDLEAYARKGPYQRYLSRESAWIFNVPEVLVDHVADALNTNTDMDPFYFNGIANGLMRGRWTVEDKCKDNRAMPGFKHLTLRFKPRLSLKAIHRNEYGGAERETLPIPKEIMPDDKQKKPGKQQYFSWEWMPYAEKVEFQGIARGTTWVDVLDQHVRFWRETDSNYAEHDIIMLRDLDRAFGFPVPDYDHTLTALVAGVRFRGFRLDREGVKQQLADCRLTVRSVEQELGFSLDKHAQVKKALIALCDEMEAVAVTGSNDAVLTSLTKWEGHPVAALAARIQQARTAKKKAHLLEKLDRCGRFHPGLRVVGTQTDRMSGANGLNPQGIDHDKSTRDLFLMQETYEDIHQYLKDCDPYYDFDDPSYQWVLLSAYAEDVELGNMRLDGGDFDGFETALVIAIWSEAALSAMVGKGLKAYWIFGSYLFHEILPRLWRQKEASRLKKELGMVEGSKAAAALVAPSALELIQLPEYKEYASRAKNCWYALVYGAQVRKIAETAGLSIEETEAAYKRMEADLPSMKDARQHVFDTLSVMVNEEEGKGFTLRPTDGVIENLLGHRRDFSREIELIETIFTVFSKLKVPKYMDKLSIVRREDKGPQKVRGAAISALIGGALRVQARMQRQGTNFQPQSSGAQINKQCQVAIWEHQPAGAHPWLVVPLNVHDEIMCSVRGELDVSGKLYEVVEKWRNAVPLIEIEWKRGIESWNDK